METESGSVEVGNAKLYYELAGEGQPLVLVHAGVADSRQWNNEFARFAQDFRVLRYDMRGYGKSLPAAGEYSHMGDLTALLDQVGINEPTVLIGCSIGGSMAMDFALAHPSKVKVLVMVGSAPSGLMLDARPHPKEAEAEEAHKTGDLERLAELETQMFFDGMGRRPQQVDQEMRRLALEMNRLALSHEAKGLGKRLPNADTPAAERLDEVEMPVLVVVGEHDEPYSLAAADYMVDKIQSARKVVLADAAHLANMDHPEQFQRAVGAFLEEVAR